MVGPYDFAKSRQLSFSVIPAKAGIHENKQFWTPASAGVTTFMIS